LGQEPGGPALVAAAAVVLADGAPVGAFGVHGVLEVAHEDISTARVEAIDTQIRMITRRAFGFHSPDALIALAML
ncbi:MAG: transposase, partial [Solirubrobacteraceae bacterium]